MSNLNQIEEIEKLYAKPKSYKIGKNEITINIMPLGLKEIGLMNMKQDAPIEEISKNMTKMWAVSLQIEEEEAEKISVEFMQEMMDSFMDANDFKEGDIKKAGIKGFIKKKQEQIKAQEENGESNKSA